MATNPLQKYFRQPKIFIKLPSAGVYCQPGNIQGDSNHMPVYGMTGMDEIIMKTPDALLTGESTVQVIASCCPSITNPWDLPTIDITIILAAIRIATFGNTITLTVKCTGCENSSEYEVDLNRIVEHYMACQYENSVVLKDLVIKLHPLTYKDSTAFNLRNFQLQQKLVQVDAMPDNDERKALLKSIFEQLADLQTDIIKSIVESIDIGDQIVSEKTWINEWLVNSDKSVFDAIKQQNQKNNATWAVPPMPVVCEHCGKEDKVAVELDESNFFVQA